MSEINNKKQYDFFISHAWADPDDKLVDQIVKGLKSNGYKVWYDRDVWGSESGRKNDFLKSGIKNSRHCIPFLCKEYFQSENSMFELEYIMKKKAPQNIFPFWSPGMNKGFLIEQPFGDDLLEIVGIPRGEDDYDPEDLVDRLIILKNSAEGLREYNSISLITEDTRVMEELEVVFGVPIPCIPHGSEEKFGFIEANNRVITLLLRERKDQIEIPIERLPNSLAKLDLLQELDVSLGLITEAITNLKSLISLQLYDSKCNKIPEKIKNLTSLRKLNLSKSGFKFHEYRIHSLPGQMRDLSSLETLNLSGNWIGNIPNIPSLQTLDLSNNYLSSLGFEIPSLKMLQYLDLRRNSLVWLPESIGNLQSLRELYIDENILKDLPLSIGNLSSLQKLSVRSNKLSNLPDTISNLKSLQYLRLDGNQLKDLPESLKNLSNLKKIILGDNPLKKNAKKILNTLEKNGVEVI